MTDHDELMAAAAANAEEDLRQRRITSLMMSETSKSQLRKLRKYYEDRLPLGKVSLSDALEHTIERAHAEAFGEGEVSQ